MNRRIFWLHFLILLVLLSLTPTHAEEIDAGVKSLSDVVAKTLKQKNGKGEDEEIIEKASSFACGEYKRLGFNLSGDDLESYCRTFSNHLRSTPQISRFPENSEGRNIAFEILRNEIQSINALWPTVHRPDRQMRKKLDDETADIIRKIIEVLHKSSSTAFTQSALDKFAKNYSEIRLRMVDDGICPYFKRNLSDEEITQWLNEATAIIKTEEPRLEESILRIQGQNREREVTIENWLFHLVGPLYLSEFKMQTKHTEPTQEWKRVSIEYGKRASQLLNEFSKYDADQTKTEIKKLDSDFERRVEEEAAKTEALEQKAQDKRKADRENLILANENARKQTEQDVVTLNESLQAAQQSKASSLDHHQAGEPATQDARQRDDRVAWSIAAVSTSVLVVVLSWLVVARSRRKNKSNTTTAVILFFAVANYPAASTGGQFLEDAQHNNVMQRAVAYASFKQDILYAQYYETPCFGSRWVSIADAFSTITEDYLNSSTPALSTDANAQHTEHEDDAAAQLRAWGFLVRVNELCDRGEKLLLSENVPGDSQSLIEEVKKASQIDVARLCKRIPLTTEREICLALDSLAHEEERKWPLYYTLTTNRISGTQTNFSRILRSFVDEKIAAYEASGSEGYPIASSTRNAMANTVARQLFALALQACVGDDSPSTHSVRCYNDYLISKAQSASHLNAGDVHASNDLESKADVAFCERGDYLAISLALFIELSHLANK